MQDSLSSEPLLIAAALVSVYLVLGILYESYVHPVTILSTLPSAGVGALLALLLTRTELTVIAIIGIILLIGLVKKNAILMIDFALAAERNEGKSSRDAIYEACLLRFRPILMTTMAAMLGAVPLALGTGMGSEFRRPLGIAIIGGLAVSQLLTLYTTPVVYLYFDRFQHWWWRLVGIWRHEEAAALGVGGMKSGSRQISYAHSEDCKLANLAKSQTRKWMHEPANGPHCLLLTAYCLLPSAYCSSSAACMVGPKYQRPTAPVPPAYKEPPPAESGQAMQEWKPAQPNDAVTRGKWWEIYNDPELNALEEQVSISNQNIKMAEAQFREAKFARADRALQPVPDDYRFSFHCELAIVGYRDTR